MSLRRLVFISLVVWLFSLSAVSNASAGTTNYVYDYGSCLTMP